jgi:hypothetical protein
LKTATPSERNTLLALLDDYVLHLEGNAGSFLAKFVGVYEVRGVGVASARGDPKIVILING